MDPMVYVQFIATLVAATAAIFSFLAVRAIGKQTRASILLGCLDAYIQIRRHRSEAITAKSQTQCEDYYRELFDLHWSEYQLFAASHIPENVMRAWLDSRWRNYREDKVEFTNEGGQRLTVTYEDMWNKLLKSGYFTMKDRYVGFMNLAHEGKIEEALRCRR
jgi:hypothetical protein